MRKLIVVLLITISASLSAKVFTSYASKSIESNRLTDNQKILVLPVKDIKLMKSGCFLMQLTGPKNINFTDSLFAKIKKNYDTQSWIFLKNSDGYSQLFYNITRKALSLSQTEIVNSNYKRNLKYRNFPEQEDIKLQFAELKKNYDFDYAIVFKASTLSIPYDKNSFTNATYSKGSIKEMPTYIQHPTIEVFVFDCNTGKMLLNTKHITQARTSSVSEAYKNREKTVEKAVKALKNAIRTNAKPKTGGFFSK